MTENQLSLTSRNDAGDIGEFTKSKINIQTHGVMAHIKKEGATLNPAYFSYCEYLGDLVILIGYLSFLSVYGMYKLLETYVN